MLASNHLVYLIEGNLIESYYMPNNNYENLCKEIYAPLINNDPELWDFISNDDYHGKILVRLTEYPRLCGEKKYNIVVNDISNNYSREWMKKHAEISGELAVDIIIDDSSSD